MRSSTLDEPGARVVTLDGHRITTFAERPLVTPNVEIFAAGERGIATAVLLPHGHDGSPLPVLLDPYGGPHALRVQRSSNAFASAQWFADQGFAVVVADGRGTPGRGHGVGAFGPPRSGHGAARRPDRRARTPPPSDTAGCSTSIAWRSAAGASAGILAALAVLRRPDVFHAAVAGAPVTEWRLYDTYYTERYLGHPDDDAQRLRREFAAPAGAPS